MVSSVGVAQTLSRIPRSIFWVVALFLLALGAYTRRDDVSWFFTGPGRISRIITLLVLIINWRSVPLSWTVRVFGALATHLIVREYHTYGPDKLFHYSICQSHAALYDIDYNLHKSNSTYFADLDISRAHLAGHLLARGAQALGENAKTKLVWDPRNPTEPAKGSFAVMLGAAHTTFKREIKPYQPYEIWTRVLSWDQKWFYMVSYFVVKGAVKPRSWDASPSTSFGPTRFTQSKPADWEKSVFAVSVSKYVFKIGRLSVHPAIVMGASGLLPERPGGWVTTTSSTTTVVDTTANDKPVEKTSLVGNGTCNGAEAKNLHTCNTQEKTDQWNWQRTEAERLKGWEYAQHFAKADELASQFDGGEGGALGRWSLG